MKQSRLNYVAVGSAVLVALALLVGALIALSRPTFGGRTLYVTYDNVSGLREGTKVLYQGFPIGSVAKILPVVKDNRTLFKVSLGLNDSNLPIPKDSKAVVSASGLLSAVVVDIRGGSSDIMIADGGELPSGGSGNIFAALNDVAREVTDLSQNSLKPLLTTINRQVDAVGGVLSSQAPEILQNMLSVSQDLAARTPRISKNMEQFSDGLSQVMSEGNVKKLDSTIDNVSRLTSDLTETRKQVGDLMGALDKMIVGNQDNVNQSLRDLRYSLGAVARNIDSVTYNLEGTSRNFNELSRELRENPSVILGGSRSPAETGPRR